jgi:DMSO/TMAO reductase YedYZ molybdopterin-dependent catalytic subunit
MGLHRIVGQSRRKREAGSIFVSIDLLTAQHPQTLLATHLNGKPLTVEHGAPLRLFVPVKLGLKNIKAITRITYTKDEPLDYWAKRGYHAMTEFESAAPSLRSCRRTFRRGILEGTSHEYHSRAIASTMHLSVGESRETNFKNIRPCRKREDIRL